MGNCELETWLSIHLTPRLDFRFYAFPYENRPVVIMEIPACRHTPVRWKETEFIRIGTYKQKLKDYPEKERSLWLQLPRDPFESCLACRGVAADDVLSFIDYDAYFRLTEQNLPSTKSGILERLCQEKMTISAGGGLCNITNLGAVLFAKKLSDFSGLGRKAVRVISYTANDRVGGGREFTSDAGYAASFERLLDLINEKLPINEHIGQALRVDARMYPSIAIRELVANAIIHQDFSMTGDSPMIEIFADRIEISNGGRPLIDPLRFIDEPPQSRNEALAAFMRRMRICEERGSGIDKVIDSVELFQLPAPDFKVTENHTKVILFAYRPFREMSIADRVRACYQHACLMYVSNQEMTNATLRKRLSIEDENYPMASRVIADAIRARLIKPYDPNSKSRKHARYLPFWA